MKTINPKTLLDELAGERRPALLDVRLNEDFQSCHLPGSLSNCVFEVAFAERLRETATDFSRPVRVIGWNDASQEGRMAVEKLERLGYADVRALEGGIEAWVAEALPVEPAPSQTPSPQTALPAIPDGRAPIDLDESRLEWTGRNLLNKHSGSAPITSGWLDFRDGLPCGGEFTVDLTRLSCADLHGSPLHDVLIAHLQDHDFFDTALHPAAAFRLTASRAITGGSPGSPNLHLLGELTLRGRAHPIAFDAVAGITPEGRPAAQAAFSIDRTKWGVLYGSGRFFKRLAGHLVNDLIEIQIRILADRPGGGFHSPQPSSNKAQ